MKPDAWMPLYIGDYLRDTLGLGRGEHGSYLLTIMAYWASGGPLMSDDATLREIAKCPLEEWPRTKTVLLRFFEERDGRWHHKRIDSELKAANEEYQRNVNRTKAATEARRKSSQAMDVQRDVVRNDGESRDVTATQSQSQSQSQPKGSPPSGKLSSAEIVKFDGELKRLNKELSQLGKATDYSAPHPAIKRIAELTARRSELRTILGVKA